MSKPRGVPFTLRVLDGCGCEVLRRRYSGRLTTEDAARRSAVQEVGCWLMAAADVDASEYERRELLREAYLRVYREYEFLVEY